MRETILHIALCMMVVLLAGATLVWAAVSGQLFSLDGLLLALFCLLVATIFFPLAVVEIRGAGILSGSGARVRNKAEKKEKSQPPQ